MTTDKGGSIFSTMAQRTPAGKRARAIFSLLFLALLIGEGWGSYFIWRSSYTAPDTLRSVSPEVAQRDAMAEVPFQRAYMELRRSSYQSAQLAIASGVNPFKKPQVAIEIPPVVPPVGPGGVPVTPPPEVQPPMVTVKAIMILGERAAAVADIEGDGQAVILRVGSSFDGGRGRVVSISTSGIRFRWRGRIYDAALQFN